MTSEIQEVKVFSEDSGRRLFLGKLKYNRKKESSVFQWSREALELGQEWSPIKFPISSHLITTDNLNPYYEGLHGIFDDSLPDGWGRHVLRTVFDRLNIPEGTRTPAFSLAFLGNSAFGSLSFEPTFSSKESVKLSLKNISDDINKLISGSFSDVSLDMLKGGMSSQGLRPKFTLDISHDWKDFQTVTDVPPEGYDSWILKFASFFDSDELPLIELLYRDLAEDFGMDVPNAKLLTISGQSVFAIKRFDRINGEKVFVHSLGGMLEDAQMRNIDYLDIAKILKILPKAEHSLEEGFKRAVFNIMFCNRDDHAKNFSFMMYHNQWKLSPAYDLTYSDGVNGNHALNVSGCNEGTPSYKDILELGIILTYPQLRLMKPSSKLNP